MNANPEYAARVRVLSKMPKRALITHCAGLGHYGFSGGVNGLGGWSRDELIAAALEAELRDQTPAPAAAPASSPEADVPPASAPGEHRAVSR